MSGIIGILNKSKYSLQKNNENIDSIDPLNICQKKVWHQNKVLMAAAILKDNNPLCDKFCKEEKYIALLCGEPIDTVNFSWGQIYESICTEKFHKFTDFKGTFAIAVYDQRKESLSLISDRTSQQPIFYWHSHDSFAFSTSLSTFCRIIMHPKFNKFWMYEMMFFNYPIGQTTFLENVLRMPPASVLTYDCLKDKLSIKSYAKHFKRRRTLIKGREALDYGLNVFRNRVPKYFESNTNLAVSLTGGFDSRTILSLVPAELMKYIETYTYGNLGCYDFIEADRVVQALNLRHKKIIFSDDFLRLLPKLIYETVMISGGLEKISRSTLLYVYSILTNKGKEKRKIVTGVSGDHLFRDHIKGKGNVPTLVSAQMMKIFQTGKVSNEISQFNNIFENRYPEFKDHIQKVIGELRNCYGELTSPESYLSYLVYETGPKHFSGESAIANNFATFVTPYWDSDIIQLSFDIEYGTIALSEKFKKKDKYYESLFQAFIIEKSYSLGNIPNKGGISMKAFTRNNKIAYEVSNALIRGPKKLVSLFIKKPTVHLENWSTWLFDTIKKDLHKLILDNSHLRKYITKKFAENIIEEKNIHWTSKIATAEIIIDLINKGWKNI